MHLELLLVLPFTSKSVSIWMMGIEVRAVQLRGNERKSQKTPIFIPEAARWLCGFDNYKPSPQSAVSWPAAAAAAVSGLKYRCSGPISELLHQIRILARHPALEQYQCIHPAPQ